MKTYYATRCQLGGTIGIREEGKADRTLIHIVRHSPTGLEWGYGGSGPSDTALSILVDYFRKDHKKASAHYQDFKWDFIASAPEAGFEITTAQIKAWLEKRNG